MRVGRQEEIGEALDALGLETQRPVLVLIGSAAQATETEAASVDELVEPLVAAAARVGATIVDGGTDVGAMRAAGRAREEPGPPLVGVAPASVVALPGEPADSHTYELEPHHTHFVLVPGSDFGAESPWIAHIAGEIARDGPSVTVLIGGGDVSWLDAAESIGAGRRILALAGSGRAADELALGESDRACSLLASGLVELLDLREDRKRLPSRVEEYLRGQ